MTGSLRTVRPTDWLVDVEAELLRSDLSELPVVDGHGHLCGVIGRAQLVAAGRPRSQDGADEQPLAIAGVRVAQCMTTRVAVVHPDQPLHRAAGLMVRRRHRRLFVARNSKLDGVLSASDLMRVVEEDRLPIELEEFMSPSIVSVKRSDTVRLATDRLMLAHHAGLVVVDGSWPVGMFTLAQALVAREASAELTVDRWMDPRIVCLPLGAPAHYAASQAAAAGVDHIIATDAMRCRGILTALDFGKLIALGHAVSPSMLN